MASTCMARPHTCEHTAVWAEERSETYIYIYINNFIENSNIQKIKINWNKYLSQYENKIPTKKANKSTYMTSFAFTCPCLSLVSFFIIDTQIFSVWWRIWRHFPISINRPETCISVRWRNRAWAHRSIRLSTAPITRSIAYKLRRRPLRAPRHTTNFIWMIIRRA